MWGKYLVRKWSISTTNYFIVKQCFIFSLSVKHASSSVMILISFTLTRKFHISNCWKNLRSAIETPKKCEYSIPNWNLIWTIFINVKFCIIIMVQIVYDSNVSSLNFLSNDLNFSEKKISFKSLKEYGFLLDSS